MNQYWYIVKNQQHFGPYDLAELELMQKQAKLDPNTVLWHPKWPAPKLNFIQKLTPPPVPQVTTVKLQTQYRKLNSLASLNRIQQHQKNYEDMTSITFAESSWKTNFDTILSKIKNYRERIFMLASCLLSTAIMFNIIEPSSIPNRPENMAPSQYEQFQNFWNNTETSASSSDQNKEFFTMISKDYKTLWIGQNQEKILESVTIFGENKKILAKSDFQKSWDQQPAQKLISITFENHELPPMGFYELRITWVESAAWSFEAHQKTQNLILKIGPQNDEQLLSMVQNFHNPPAVNNQGIAINSSQAELKEKYQTLSSLITDLKRNWDEIKDLNHPKMVKAMNSFQKDYARSTGSFLTAFVLSNEKEIKTLSQGQKAVNTSLIAHLHNLTENAKKTGVLSAELMSNYLQYAKNPKKNELWSQKISNLEKDLQDKMGQL